MDEIQDIEKSEYQLAMSQAWDAYNGGQLDSAKQICEGLIAQYPEKSYCHYLLGHIFLHEELYQSAADEFMAAQKGDKDGENDGYVYYWLGEVYSKRSWVDDDTKYIYDKDKAEQYYQLARKAKNFPLNLLLRYEHQLKGQDRVDLYEEGIERFPDTPDFYIKLAQHYQCHGMSKMQLATFSRAIEKEFHSSSLFYNIGHYYYEKKDYNTAFEQFEKALSCNGKYPGYNFGINYWLGKTAEKLGHISQAEVFFDKAYKDEQGFPDCLFGFFGLLDTYLASGSNDKLRELVLNLNLQKDIIEDGGRITGGPMSLSEHVADSIRIDDLAGLYQRFNKLKLDKKNGLLNGKIWILRYFLAVQLAKYNDQYKAIKNAVSNLNTYHYDFLDGFLSEALSNLLYYKVDSESDIMRLYTYLIADLDNYVNLPRKFAHYIDELFKLFFDRQHFDKIIKLSKFFTKEQISEYDGLFRLAYAYAEVKDKANAKTLYQLYLKQHGDNTAVLNNLANLFDEEGDYQEAIALYRRGLKIDADHPNLNKNLKSSLQRQASLEEKATKEKNLRTEYLASTNSLQAENDYVLDKLSQFIEQIKKDESFENWEIPVPKYKFQKYLGVDKQRAESLLSQWLAKGYLRDTKERDDHSVIIYAINPFIEEELNRIQKRKIPKQWIDGFMRISVEALESSNYFLIMDRMEKIAKKFRPLFERDFNELTYNYLMGHEKASIILSGSLVELALIFYCEKKKVTTIPVQDSGGKVKNKKLYACVLNELIVFVEQSKSFGADFVHLSNLSRIYRNFVHPGLELKDTLDKSKADICFLSTVEILKKIL